MAKIGVGVIGCGGNGRRHAELYNSMDEFELVGVCDIDPAAAERVAKRHGVKAFSRVEDLVSEEGVEAVSAVNSGSHCEPVVTAAEAGKHALVEVSFAPTVEECDRMIAASEKAGKNLMYAQTHRYYPFNIKIKSLIDSGEIGEIVWISFIRTDSSSPDSDQWHRWIKTGGGTLIYEGPHYTDQIRWMAGSDYESAVAMGMGRYASGGDGEDTILGGFRFKSGAFAALIDGKSNPGGTYSDWRITGTEGMIELVGSGGPTARTSPEVRLGKGEWTNIDYPHKNDAPVEGFERLGEATHYWGFLNEFREFAASINEGRQPASTGYDGRASIEAALAMRKAGETGEVVHFPL